MIYILVYLFYFAIVGLGFNTHRLRLLLLIASIPMVAIALLRGAVGVDTLMYEQSIDIIRATKTYTFTFEPIFELAALFLSLQLDNSLAILMTFAMLTTLLLYRGGYNLERQPYLLAFFVIPYFYLDMTMNGIRYGLAFSIVLYASQFLLKGKKYIYSILVVIAALIQVSSILLALMLLLLIEMRWRILLFSIASIFIIYFLFIQYFQVKIEGNSSLTITSPFSGFSPFLLSFLMLIVFWSNTNFRREAKIQILILAALSICAYAVTQFYYAGLRFQFLNLFLICIFSACVINAKRIFINKKTVLALLLIGIMATGFRLNNFYSEAGKGDAPFVPYKFFWEGEL